MSTSPNPTDPVVRVKDLSVTFDHDRSAGGVRSVSFSLYPGKTLAIVGESGSGKTLSSLALIGLLPEGDHVRTDGLVSITGVHENLLDADEPVLRAIRGARVAMVFQEPMTSLNPILTCGEQVGEMLLRAGKLSGDALKEAVIGLFTKVRLPRPDAMYSQYPHQLSGGQRQRVMIAMAIAARPDVLLADEPTTALDVTVQKEILLLLRELQQESGMAMIFITHDLSLVSEIADDVCVMRAGKVVERGPAQEVLSHPQHPYTRGLLACRPGSVPRQHHLPTLSELEKGEAIFRSYRSGASPEALLRVTGLSKVYPGRSGFMGRKAADVRAVDDVSFEVMRGETLGLVGESGCGKTTLSRMLLRLIEPSSGRIEFAGTDLLSMGKEEMRQMRRKMQIVFQDPFSSLNPRMTVGQALQEPLRAFGLHKGNQQQRVEELLLRVGLDGSVMQRFPHEFSGGQRQRIVIARALVVEPEFIICDESVSALDVSVQAQVLNLLNELKQDFGLTYIFISHDLNVVRHMSDRVMVMNKGRIEEMASADTLFARPQSEYTRKLIAAMPGGTML